MDGILEQILKELQEINQKLSCIQQQELSKTTLVKTVEMLPDLVTVDDIKCYLNIGITQAYSIINLPEFTQYNMGKKKCIPKDQFILWTKKEQHKRAVGVKKSPPVV